MTEKQQQFVLEYLRDFNATQAAIRAGYSTRRAAEIGYENLRKPQIQAALAEQIEQRRKRVQVEVDHVVGMLLVEARRTGEGSSHGARVRAIELLGKHIGMFRDEIDVWHRIEKLSPDEARQLNALDDAAFAAALGIPFGGSNGHGRS